MTAASAPARFRLEGTLSGSDPEYVYVPFAMPLGVEHVRIRFSSSPKDRGRVGFGLFSASETVARDDGFRGWSDHWRSEIELSAGSATRGYIPGAIEPGVWRLMLAPFDLGSATVAWEIEIELGFGPGQEPAKRHPSASHLASGPGWYRGDLHVHSDHSADAGPGRRNYSPVEIAERAREAGLDFIASTDHNTPTAHWEWGLHAQNGLLVVNGEEVTMRGGHLGAIGLDAGTWIDFRACSDAEVDDTISVIRAHGGFAILNHPMRDNCPDCSWRFSPHVDVDAIEVWNGAWKPSNEAALTFWDQMLVAGRRVLAVGGSDAHREPDRVGLPQTVVHAPELSHAGILEGLRSGRVFVARDHELGAHPVVRDRDSPELRAEPGDELRHSDLVAPYLEVSTIGAGDCGITVHSARGIVGRASSTADGGPAEIDLRSAPLDSFLRVEVRDSNATPLVLSNPVWVV